MIWFTQKSISIYDYVSQFKGSMLTQCTLTIINVVKKISPIFLSKLFEQISYVIIHRAMKFSEDTFYTQRTRCITQTLLHARWSVSLLNLTLLSHQTSSHYVLENGLKLCTNGLNVLRTVWGLFTNFIERTRTGRSSRTLNMLKIFSWSSFSAIRTRDNVLMTSWTYYERNCRTSVLLGTLVQRVELSEDVLRTR